MVNRIFTEEEDPMSSDIWQNFSDAIYLLDSKCNIFSSGILSLGVLYLTSTISEWALNHPDGSKIIWGIIAYFGIQLYSDWNKLIAIYITNFGSHFDAHSIGNLFGKFTNLFVNFISFYIIASATGATLIA